MSKDAQKYLLDNNCGDLILNDRIDTKPKDRIYASDIMDKFSEFQNKELIEFLIIEVTKEADRLYPNPHDIRKAMAFVSGGNYILNQFETNKK